MLRALPPAWPASPARRGPGGAARPPLTAGPLHTSSLQEPGARLKRMRIRATLTSWAASTNCAGTLARPAPHPRGEVRALAGRAACGRWAVGGGRRRPAGLIVAVAGRPQARPAARPPAAHTARVRARRSIEGGDAGGAEGRSATESTAMWPPGACLGPSSRAGHVLAAAAEGRVGRTGAPQSSRCAEAGWGVRGGSVVQCKPRRGGAAPRGQGLMPLRRAPLASGRGVRADCRSVPCVRREAQKGKNAVARPGCCSKACGADR